ncbi:hypothetical protein LUZ60_017620 [Juncus effusus]|nr:hypothetical protein LUZ60_017620 [Juncus effusus]
MTESDVIRHMIQRSRSRLASLLSKLARSNSPASASKAQMQIQYGNYEYLMELSIGTPRLRYLAILDTGSDLIWTQCQPCIMCFGQPTPLFDPSHSSTYRQLTCSDMLCKKLYGFHGSSNRCMTCRYTYAYAGDAYTEGILSSESFIIGDSFLANLSFGCGDTNHGDVLSQAAGIVGLGRGSFSLTTQLGIDKFSYCLASPLTKFKSILKLGPEDQFADHTKARVITLAPNPYNEKIFYHITLKGIRVGNTSIAVANHMLVVPSNSNNTGGMIVDSGTAITYLEQAVFDMVLAAFVSQMDLLIGDGSGLGLDLCFMLPGSENIDTVYIPDMVFQFEGDDLELDRANYFGVEKSTSQMCLMMAASNGLSILELPLYILSHSETNEYTESSVELHLHILLGYFIFTTPQYHISPPKEKKITIPKASIGYLQGNHV